MTEASDPNTIDTSTGYGLVAFAAEHGLSMRAAEIILYSNGPSRVACDAAAKAFLAAVRSRTKVAE
jgi:hypothetical protein